MKYQFQPTCQIPPETLDKIYMDAFGFKRDGVFVEVGAHDAWHWSNTWGLAEIGWRGVYVEPVRELYEQCVQTNKNRPKVDIDHCCIGSFDGVKKLGIAEYGASADAKDAEFEARQITLSTLLENHKIPPRFDLLVIDVEGSEKDVLAGFDLGKWQPTLIIIERQPDLKLGGYEHVYSDWINDCYRRTDHANPT